jgi:RHS repeat-associated protein
MTRSGGEIGELVLRAYSYEAFGKVRVETEAPFAPVNRYTYTARESIGDSLGLLYYRWRVMDPNVGRFTSEDPLGFNSRWSAYNYVVNNPLAFIDPEGQLPAYPCLVCAACGAAALIDCTAICAFGYWDDPCETFPDCMGKCMEAAATAGWISLGCLAHCVACGFVQ